MNIITNEKPRKKSKSVKCPHCEQQLERDTEPFVEHSKRFYHQDCFNTRFADIQARNELYEYVCKLQNVTFLNTFIMKQIKEYQEYPYNFTLKGMLTTLKYAHEIEGVEVKKDVGIGIIEFYYKKAISYHTNLYKVRLSSESIEYDNNETIVYASPPETRKKKLINIAEL